MNEQEAPKVGAKAKTYPDVQAGGPTEVTREPSNLTIPLALPLTTDDPNFDPDWDWTLDEPHDLFALTQSGVQIFENVRLPYYSDSGPAADDFNSDVAGVRDILPEDGWVLLFRDFGTPTRGAVFPRFILYNRYRGLLRLFYFNPHFPEVFTYGAVTLRKQSASGSFGLLTFTDETRTTLSDFDPERREVFIGRLEPFTWNYADFVVAGYDPDLPDDARFEFEVAGVRESDITLEGAVELEQVLKQRNLAASGGLGPLELGEKAVSLFKNFGALKDAVEKLSEVGSLKGMTNVISAGIALFKFFLGGSKPKQTQVLKFSGELDLSGTIRLQGAVGSFLLRVPGARHLGNTDLPFYDRPLGVFNLRSKPVVDVTVDLEPTKCRNTSDFGPKILTLPLPRYHRHKLKRPQVTVNPDAGFSATVEAAYVRSSGAADGYFALSNIRTATDSVSPPGNCDDPWPEVRERSIAIRVTVTPDDLPPDFTPVTLVKIYPTEYSEAVVVVDG